MTPTVTYGMTHRQNMSVEYTTLLATHPVVKELYREAIDQGFEGSERGKYLVLKLAELIDKTK